MPSVKFFDNKNSRIQYRNKYNRYQDILMLCDRDSRFALQSLDFLRKKKKRRTFYFAQLQDVSAFRPRTIPRTIEDEIHSHILIALFYFILFFFIILCNEMNILFRTHLQRRSSHTHINSTKRFRYTILFSIIRRSLVYTLRLILGHFVI